MYHNILILLINESWRCHLGNASGSPMRSLNTLWSRMSGLPCLAKPQITGRKWVDESWPYKPKLYSVMAKQGCCGPVETHIGKEELK